MKVVDIGPPPEFGSDGSAPPFESAPVEIARWGLDGVTWRDVFSCGLSRVNLKKLRRYRGDDPFHFNTELAAAGERDAHDCANLMRFIALNEVTPQEQRYVNLWKFEAVFVSLWQREDPLTQYPPGVSGEVTIRARLGISQERTRELAQSFGITGGDNRMQLSAQLSHKSATKVSLLEEIDVSRSIKLTNDSTNRYRRFAIWQSLHRLSVLAELPGSIGLISGREPPRKVRCTEEDFRMSDVTSVTSIDVAQFPSS